MYILPQSYYCPKCGTTCEYSPHDDFEGITIGGSPLCPQCWRNFILEHVPKMKCKLEELIKPTSP